MVAVESCRGSLVAIARSSAAEAGPSQPRGIGRAVMGAWRQLYCLPSFCSRPCGVCVACEDQGVRTPEIGVRVELQRNATNGVRVGLKPSNAGGVGRLQTDSDPVRSIPSPSPVVSPQ